MIIITCCSTELVRYFEEKGWTCDDCKPCIVCELSSSESEKEQHSFFLLYNSQGKLWDAVWIRYFDVFILNCENATENVKPDTPRPPWWLVSIFLVCKPSLLPVAPGHSPGVELLTILLLLPGYDVIISASMSLYLCVFEKCIRQCCRSGSASILFGWIRIQIQAFPVAWTS
jgi:hypothetical protein